MDVLDLRNLAFDCAENMSAPDGETAVTRSYSYSNGRTFTSDTNSRWGHGILSLTCLYTPNGGLQDPDDRQSRSPAASTGRWPGRSPADAGDARAVAVGVGAAERIANLRGAGQAPWRA